MTTYVTKDGIRCIKAEEGRALCKAEESGPSAVTSVSLGSGDAFEGWKDCDYCDPSDETTEVDKDAALRRFGVEV